MFTKEEIDTAINAIVDLIEKAEGNHPLVKWVTEMFRTLALKQDTAILAYLNGLLVAKGIKLNL